MAQSTPTYTLTSSSALSDDYILTADVLVDLQSSAPVGVFSPGGQPQALFIRSDGVLCQIVPSSGTGASGWHVSTVGTTSGVNQVAAGVQMDGTSHGFYTDSVNLYHVANSGGAWSAPDVLPFCSGLGVATNPLTGELIAFGVDSGGNLLFVRERNGRWAATSLETGNSLVGTQPVLLLVDALCDWVFAVPGTATSGGQLDVYQGSPTAVTAGPRAVAVPEPVAAVLTGFWMDNSALFLFTDIHNNLYSNVGTTAHVVKLESGLVKNAAAVVDLVNAIHLYSIDPNGMLSVLHQVGRESAIGPKWAPRIPLDTGFLAVYVDSNPTDATALFAVDAEGALWYSAQDSVSGTWSTTQAQMPSGARGYQVAQYRTKIQVVDQDGNPASNLSIGVTSSAPSGVLFQGLWYPTSTKLSATIATDATGAATLSTIALGVSTPSLTFSATNLTPPGPINPAGAVQKYLGGSGTLNGGRAVDIRLRHPGRRLRQREAAGSGRIPELGRRQRGGPGDRSHVHCWEG